MSEKRVNIKITASTSDFEKAIKNAQKQIEKLAETIDDIGKGKFGDKLEKQVDKVADAAKKAQNELDDTKDILDDINKAKVDKVKKQLDKTTDSVEDLTDELEDTKDNIDDLKKAKINKLEKQFDSARKVVDKLDDKLGDVVDSLKDLDGIDIDDIRKSFENIREANDDLKKNLENLANEFKDLDSQDLNRLENELDRIDTSIRDMRDGVKDAASDLDKHFRDATSEVRDFDDAMDDIDYDSIDKIKDDVKDLDKFLEKSLGDMGDKNLNIETNVKTKGSDKGSFISDMATEFAGAEIVGKRVSSAIQEMKEGLDKTIESMKDMSGLTVQEQVKSYDDLIDRLNKTQDEMKRLEKEYSDKSGNRSDIEAKMEESKKLKENNDKVLAEVNRNYTEALKELENFQKKYNEQIERMNNVNPDFKKHMDSLIALEKELRELTGADELISDFEKSLHNLGDSLYDELGDFASKSKLIKQLSDELKNLKALDEEDGDIEFSFFDAFEEVDKHFQEFMPRMEANIDKLIKKLRDLGDVNLESLINDFESLWKSQDDLNILDDEDFDKLHNIYSKMTDDLKAMEEINADEPLRKIAEQSKGVIEAISAMAKGYRELDSLNESFATAYGEKKNSIDQNRVEGIKELIKAEKDYVRELERSSMVWKDSRGNTIDSSDVQRAMLNGAVSGSTPLGELSYREWADELEEYQAELEKANKRVEEARKEQEKLAKEYEEAAEALKKYETEAQELQDELDALKDSIDKGNKITEEQADNINEQLQAYDKLSKRVRDYLSDEEKSILLREKVAKSFKNVSNAMEQVYGGASKNNNADLINKTLEEAIEYVKELNLVSTKNLQNDLNRLGDILEDKTDKVKRFKDLMNEYGSKDSGLAYWLEEESKALKNYANDIPVVVEAMDTLRKAWGDVSIGDEDHLKLRARSELLDDYVDNLKKNVAHIKNYYEVVQGPITQEQQMKLDDWEAWERNKEAVEDYNKAITEYMSTIKDMGGQVDDKFLDSFGKFDFDKFVEDFDKMGTSTVVLSKRLNAVKSALLENLKTEKEESRVSLENAKANEQQARAEVEAAKAAKKAAKSDEDKAKASKELADARERLANAEKELADAQKKSKNIDTERIENAKKLVKQYNEQAEAARKLGIAIEDISKADISSFDKSLGSLLDGGGVFGDDSPFSLGDIKEDIKAIFSDMGTFDFGSVFDGLKGIVSSLFSKIPMELQAAVGIAAAIGVALKKSAEMGIEHFGKGVGTIKSALSTVVDVARDIGQELVSAFENITGMDLDFSSMIELPVNFESQIAKVGAITGTTGTADFEELEEEARRLGSTTRYSATEVAEAMEYMGMAGWDNKQILTGLESVLSLATVAQMDLGQASDFVTDGLTALGYEAEDAAKFVDILAKASTSSNTSVAQMQKAFTNCAPVAGTLGVSMEDLSIALGLMADKGVKGAKAGTALKNLMANLSAPTEKQLAFIKKFNLEGAQQDIVQGNLIEGLKKFKSALSSLTPQQQNAVITTIAGKEALSGISALLNTTESDLSELEDAIRNCDGAATEMANNFDDTVKGALLGLSSAMQETVLQIFDKCKDDIKTVTKQLTEFFNILNGYSTEGNGSGLSDALSYLEEISEGWSEAIAQNLENAIGAIDNFINGGALDSLLQVGTNIIDGICNGIQAAADNGTLDSAISGAIKRIATWFSENLDTIIEVGGEIIDAISQGISDNGDEIGECIKQVMEMQTEIDKAVAHEKWKLIGENLVTFILEGLWSKITVFWSGLTGFLESGITEAFGFIAEWMTTGISTLFFDPIQSIGIKIGEWLRDAIIEKVQEAFNIDISDWNIWNWGDKKKDNKKSTSSKKSSAGKTPDTSSITGKSPIDLINSELSSGKVKTDTTAAEIGQGISDNITKKLETMDATQLKALNTEMQNLQTTTQSLANGMATSFTAIQNAARTSFMGLTNIVRNQMINCTNIVRNQAINWYNIIANQTTNARTIFTQKFMSMAAVARTQMVNVSNIIRNQAMTWYNIINNQITNARNAFTRQMISMASVARTQMTNVTNIIRNQTANWKTAIDNASKNLATSASNIGKNISSGISKGISSGTSTISSAVNNYKNSLLGKVKSAFGIHSPSTVMRDEVGTYLALGIEEGVANGATNISSIVNDTLNSINSRMSGMNNSNLISVDTTGIKTATLSMNALGLSISQMSLQIKMLTATFKTLEMTIRSIAVQMSNMASLSRSMSINTGGTMSTNYANALYAANNASTMSLGNNMSALASNASYAMSTGGGSAAGSSIGSNVTLEIPVMLDGKELARASAKYVDSELKLMTKRENRKRGAK